MGKKKTRSDRADFRLRLMVGAEGRGVSLEGAVTAVGLWAVAGLVGTALLSSAMIVRAARVGSKSPPPPPQVPEPQMLPEPAERPAELAAPVRRRLEERRPWHAESGAGA